MAETQNPCPGVMPGQKKRMAEALNRNILFLVAEFGLQRIGFLTLTVGSDSPGGRFVQVWSRADAQARFHSLLPRMKDRYQCGVTVSERHKSKALHFHCIVVVGSDIRTGVDFEAFKRGDYRTAPKRLRLEWLWWRNRAPDFGFGRCQLLPIRKNGEAVARYAAKYISKGFEARLPEDKGARLINYFGRWSAKGVNVGPPWSARHASVSPRAQAWRQCCAQISLALGLNGVKFDPVTAKSIMGQRWAWAATRKIRLAKFFIRPRLSAAMNEGLSAHNGEHETEWTGRDDLHVGKLPAGFWTQAHNVSEPDYAQHKNRRDNNRAVDRELSTRQAFDEISALEKARKEIPV